eukprot:968580-Rhodomonas_salina.1
MLRCIVRSHPYDISVTGLVNHATLYCPMTSLRHLRYWSSVSCYAVLSYDIPTTSPLLVY